MICMRSPLILMLILTSVTQRLNRRLCDYGKHVVTSSYMYKKAIVLGLEEVNAMLPSEPTFAVFILINYYP